MPQSKVEDITSRMPRGDAPEPRPREDSSNVAKAAASFVDGLIGERLDASIRAALREAIPRVVDAAIKEHDAANEGDDTPASSRSPSLRGLVVAIVIAAAAVVLSPVVERLLPSRESETAAHLDRIEALIEEQRADVAGLTRWMWDIEQAEKSGGQHPGPPPSVRLNLAREDKAREESERAK